MIAICICNYFVLNLRTKGANFDVCHSCRSTMHYFKDCPRKLRYPWCPRGIQKCFQVERNTGNKGRLFKTCSNDCGYFDWVKNEESTGESSTINEAVNVGANEEAEDLPKMFDLARIDDKRDVEISVNVTFRKGKGRAE